MAILFTNDWMKHPGAIIHYNTTNQSFLRLAEIYNKMGVSNCAFHLALLDKGLDGVDPYDENLSPSIQGRILQECKDNFWYFLREVVRIPVPGSLNPIQFRANRANIAMYWMFFNHVTTLIVILRQTGKTTLITVLLLWLLDIGTTNTFVNFLTKSEGLKSETLLKLKALFAELPDYLNFTTKKDIFNTDEANVGLLSNKVKGNLSSSSPKQAEKVGRGFTSPINMLDEVAFIENIAIAMGAMLMSGNDARERARLNGKEYGTILATTAGNTSDRDGSYIYNLYMNSTRMNEHFFDAENQKELMELIHKNSLATKNASKRPMISISPSYRQLGYDDEWLKRTIADNISTPENIKRDLFNMWLSGTSASPIPAKYLEAMAETAVDAPRVEFYAPYNYMLYWYITEEDVEYRINNGHSFIIGVDTSDGVGMDDISFILRDHYNGEILCVAVFNEINLITLADFFVSFLVRYPNSTMIIERKSSAVTMIDYMIQKLTSQGINPFNRMYNTVYQNKDENPEDFEIVSKARSYNEDVFVKYKKTIGFVTSGAGVTSRSALYSTTLMGMLKYTCRQTYDERLISQISGLIIKNNRIDHADGGNDDLVVGSLLSYWMLVTGKNLGLYGIDQASIMKGNRTYLDEKYKKDDSDYDEREAAEQEAMFNEILEAFKAERDHYIASKLEAKLVMLSKGLNSMSNSTITIQEMIDNINREKKTNKLRR